ncbi:hypothetical protein F4813DRAFT_161386 [Daldinia decipiens]|uniref:uncharacterized protein n=1 Tax=Daldinia decipiens TaxID=326647 RepID=UPI0020C2C887|nr:uncharacterized protein F4813DRAFT_161386 [Daldinia decipiens]KAI1655515.1 hypothetical protein F4813DRAFT_161386 [Daldinia decipiens]
MAFIGCLNSHLDYGYGLTGIRTQRTRDETRLPPKSLLIFLLLDYHTILIVFSCFAIPLISHMPLFRLVRCFVSETGEILARDVSVLGSRIDSCIFGGFVLHFSATVRLASFSCLYIGLVLR